MAERSPTLTLLVVFAAVFCVQVVGRFAGIGYGLFALSLPLVNRPWTLVTSVYAHASLPHLLGNSLALAIVGIVVERSTTRARFHAFFLLSGVVAGVAQVSVAALLARKVAVLGASGAIFALVGYLLAGNRVTDTVLDRLPLPQHVQVGLAVAVALAVTLLTQSPGVALVAHFVGLVVGLLAGRSHLLQAPPSR